MPSQSFSTVRLARRLKEAKFADDQAEIAAEIFGEALDIIQDDLNYRNTRFVNENRNQIDDILKKQSMPLKEELGFIKRALWFIIVMLFFMFLFLLD